MALRLLLLIHHSLIRRSVFGGDCLGAINAPVHLITGHSLSQNRDLLVSKLHLLLVVLIFVLVDQHLFQTLILDFIVVHQQVLQLLIHVCLLLLPTYLFLLLLKLELLDFVL